MYVRFVPMNGAEFKHAKIQVDAAEVISSLREKVEKQFNSSHFKVLYHGRQISDISETLSFYKMNPNSTIHVIETVPEPEVTPPEEPVKKPPPSEEELQRFLTAFGLAVEEHSFHKVAQRLGKRDNLENILATIPELAKDPTACAFLTKPELLHSLLDANTLKYVYEKHPGLIEAAYQLAAAVYEEKNLPKQANPGAQAEPEVSNPFSYNLDEMSDDDDDGDEMETGEARGRPGGSRRSLGEAAPITADQLASAISRAQSALGLGGGMTGFSINRPSGSNGASGSGMNLPGSSSGMTSRSNSNPGNSRGITQDQLTQALALACGQAFQPPPSMTGNAGTGNSGGNQGATPNYSAQLATMREVGIVDDGLATRALEIMGGDVQAAIDLIFSGWNGNE